MGVVGLVGLVGEPTIAYATDADKTYNSWSEVSSAVTSQIEQGKNEYNSANMAGAATRFQAAYNSVYVASNFITVVRDTIGQDKVQSQSDQFQQLQTLVYQQNQSAQISEVASTLERDIAPTASQIEANPQLDSPNV